ncbi:hypothetical protein [Streptomyces sp. NPDC051636]|uniref:hypothetical protein n=1 Tax=Streptomyces sp. NPDC051636 TaxID=3365663 RepID=UPI0037ACB69B
METFLEAGLDLEESALHHERGPGEAAAIVGDKDIRLLLRESRIALAKGATVRLPDQAAAAVYDVPLTCVIHAHPRCRVRWSRLSVDLSPTAGAIIADMAPREVVDDRPVEITTASRAGGTFSLVANVLGTELGLEQTRQRTVYYPKILSSGIGFARGYWDFLADSDSYLHSDRELRLLITAPEGTPVQPLSSSRASEDERVGRGDPATGTRGRHRRLPPSRLRSHPLTVQRG